MVLMTPVGAGIHGSIYHSHSFDSTAVRLPGWKIFMPSNPRDAYGMMLAAIDDPNPVMVLLPKALMRARSTDPAHRIPGEPDNHRELAKLIDAPLGDRSDWKPEWPDTAIERVAFGEARVLREGADLTVVSYGRGLLLCEQAAAKLDEEGIDAEVVDLRCLHPYDWPTIERSILRTGRVLYVNEDTEVTNFGEHLIRRTVERLFDRLDAAPALHAGAHLPGVGLADTLENASVPGVDSVTDAMRKLARQPARRVSGAFVPRAPTVEVSDMLEREPELFDFRDALAASYRLR
jgi:2-oxoisovalerate dehydrogenase E1 component beta subunit